MGLSSSHELLLEEWTVALRCIKQRVAVLETETAALRRSVINNNVAHNEHSRRISKIDGHLFNMKLLEEGRSRSVRYQKPNKDPSTQSLFLHSTKKLG